MIAISTYKLEKESWQKQCTQLLQLWRDEGVGVSKKWGLLLKFFLKLQIHESRIHESVS